MILALVACLGGSAGDPVSDALGTGADALSACDGAFEELETTCFVAVAAKAAGAGDEAVASEACARIATGLWREECHFRVGEELGKLAEVEAALAHCGQAGRFASNCVTHAAWRMRPVTRSAPGDPGAMADLAAFAERVDAVLTELPRDQLGEARDALLARAWFHLYFGSGTADPRAARMAPDGHEPHARTAFALEVLRLNADPEAVMDVWNGAEVPTGSPLGPEQRIGRHAPAVIPEGTHDALRVPTYGGGQRLVAPSADDDLQVAAVSAAFFLGWDADRLLAWADHPSREVRDTAIGLAVLASDRPRDVVDAFLDHEDAAVRAMAREALKVRLDLDRRRQ